jgi:hypothetical protein
VANGEPAVAPIQIHADTLRRHRRAPGDDGSLTAIFTGGGVNGTPRERYSLNRAWTNQGLSLQPDKAIEQPPNSVMAPLADTLQGGRILGRVVHPQCTQLVVDRK